MHILFILINLKHYFFRYSITFIVSSIVLSSIIILFVKPHLDWQLMVAAIGTGLSFIYFIQKQKLEELSLFNDLFKVFNKRYCDLECKLLEVYQKDLCSDLDSVEKDVLIDYFNLCGEEFLYYRLGYVYPEVWRAWLRGMQYYYNNSRIKKFWCCELSQGSYYGLNSHIISQRI